MRLRMIPAVQEFPAEFHSALSTDQGEAVRDLGAAQDRQARQEDLRSEIAKTWDIESDLAGNIRDNVKVGVIPLHLKSILSGLAE